MSNTFKTLLCLSILIFAYSSQSQANVCHFWLTDDTHYNLWFENDDPSNEDFSSISQLVNKGNHYPLSLRIDRHTYHRYDPQKEQFTNLERGDISDEKLVDCFYLVDTSGNPIGNETGYDYEYRQTMTLTSTVGTKFTTQATCSKHKTEPRIDESCRAKYVAPNYDH